MMCINAAESTSSDEESMVDHDSHILRHNIYSHMCVYIYIERERHTKILLYIYIYIYICIYIHIL